MVFDRYTHEYHLTPSGWVSGNFAGMEDSPRQISPPDDRVETWEERMYQQSGWSKENITWRRTWVSPDYSEEQRKKLHEKFPKDLSDKVR